MNAMVAEHILLNNLQQSDATSNYHLLLQAGFHKQFSEMVHDTAYDNLFQAMEFRRFCLLDDFIYHLELCLELPSFPCHFELCC